MTGQGADGGAESCAASSKGRKYEYHRSYLGTLLFFLVAIYMTVIMFLSWVGVFLKYSLNTLLIAIFFTLKQILLIVHLAQPIESSLLRMASFWFTFTLVVVLLLSIDSVSRVVGLMMAYAKALDVPAGWQERAIAIVLQGADLFEEWRHLSYGAALFVLEVPLMGLLSGISTAFSRFFCPFYALEIVQKDAEAVLPTEEAIPPTGEAVPPAAEADVPPVEAPAVDSMVSVEAAE